MGTYFAIVTCRNSELTIEKAIYSLHNQSVKPQYIITIDDGSTDQTPRILDHLKTEIKNLFIITNPDLGYDVTRIVKNWNKALRFLVDNQLDVTDYHMIATDDTIYETDYAKKIISIMDNNPDLAIASGSYSNYRYEKPHGAGRFVRNSFFRKVHEYYPEKMGYESVVLITAQKNGMNYAIVRDAIFEHTRQLGQDHHFYEFGASMRTLGYHPIFALGRFANYFISGKPIGRLGAIYMFYHYIFYKPKNTGYDSMYPIDIRLYLRKKQLERIKSLFRFRNK
ncbi:glycosyltransferase family A protein [Candidatus Nitrosocosmicus agrestis]|jgi:glycosyltransferase involved in cell wall biosynthesis|uniref:glycosyltransferase family A protein n=1 Tax=Candidatus Nitrosocosmicus agrestis TaxID=2563600 RepID=UPI00122E170F|nr:glycosyltransferase family A protein [Candidatus Nitrosocosmicus sp. SS]KAA2278933.1 glycosyltransferase family 2 protein [Candidatus Nitrosocosmicus sp. SS]KAF0867623.1 glycosyltransferase family 2 protein [Candidatus Nitrosocosmicus sp. SS]